MNPDYYGIHSDPPDGTEGYASITLTVKNQYRKTETIRTTGIFVKDDSNLQEYFNIPSTHTRENPDRFFVYFYCPEQGWKDKLQTFHIKVYRFNKSRNAVKECDILRENVAKFWNRESHNFVLNTCHEKLQTPKFRSFLKQYSKSVTRVYQPLLEGREYKGVDNTGSKPTSIEFRLKSVLDSNNGLYIKTADVFEKLDDGPLLCKVGDAWNVVGWYEKDSQHSNRLIVYHLRAQEPFYIWKDLQSCEKANEHQGDLNQPRNTTDGRVQSGPVVDQPSASDQGNNESTQPGLSAQPSASTNNEPNSLQSAVQLTTSSSSEANRTEPADLASTSANNESNRPEPAVQPSTSANNEPNRPEPAVQPSTSSNNDPDQPGQYQANLNHQNRGSFFIKCVLQVVTVSGVLMSWAAGSAYVLYRYSNDPDRLLGMINRAIIPSMNSTVANVRKIMEGCFKLLIETSSLEAFELIWKSYKKGDLKDKLKEVIVTDELRSKAPDDAEDVDISITISEEDYRKTRDYLLEVALRNYIGATSARSSLKEAISKCLQDYVMCLQDKDKETELIEYSAGLIKWKVANKLLLNATNVSVLDGKIRLEIPSTLEVLVQSLIDASSHLDVRDDIGRTPLTLAVQRNKVDLVALLIKSRASLNNKDRKMRTPLMYAIEAKDENIIRMLIDAKADVNIGYWEWKTPLRYAVETKDEKIINMLIDAKADVNIGDWECKTPLMYAIETKDEKIVDMLIKACANVTVKDKKGTTALMYAATKSSKEVVETLLKNDADVTAQNHEGKTALMYAATGSSKEVIETLLKNSADVTAKDNQGKSALMYAATGSSHEVVETLLNAGAKATVKYKDKKGKTALMYAATKSSKEVVETLLKNGADVTAKDHVGKNALMYAATGSSKEVIETLLKNSADVTAKDNQGKSALMYAATESNEEVVETLLNAGAKATVKDKDIYGKTALMYAATESNEEVIKTLLKNGADVTAKDHVGKNALMYAATGSSKEVIETLLENSADVTAKDNQGKSVLMYAATGSSHEVVETLLNAGAKVTVKDKDNEGKTALMYAATGSSHQVVETLLNAGAKATVKDKDNQGKTVLMYAAEMLSEISTEIAMQEIGKEKMRLQIGSRDFYKIVRRLIYAGADVNIPDLRGKTPLMYFVGIVDHNIFRKGLFCFDLEFWCKKIVLDLIMDGADIDATDETGRTALDYANAAGNVRIRRLLECELDRRPSKHKSKTGYKDQISYTSKPPFEKYLPETTSSKQERLNYKSPQETTLPMPSVAGIKKTEEKFK